MRSCGVAVALVSKSAISWSGGLSLPQTGHLTAFFQLFGASHAQGQNPLQPTDAVAKNGVAAFFCISQHFILRG